DPMLDETDQPTLTDFVEEGSNVRVKNEVHLLVGDPDRQSVQRIMLAALRPKAIAEPEELFLVDAVQHRNGRSLDDLVFELRRRLPGIVRRLQGYYGGVRLPTVVHHRLRLLAFPMRT